VAEVADDHVTATTARLEVPTEWREWEVELVDAEPALLDAVDVLLSTQGVGRSPVQRKIEMVLGRPRPPADPEPPGRTRPARLLLHPYLAAQVRQIEILDPVVRGDGPGGVHGIRKACRRLRAVLAAYRALLQREPTQQLRDELRWLALGLGEARDHEVVRHRLEALLDADDEDLVVGPVRGRVQEWGEVGTTLSRHFAAELLSSARYHELRDTLDGLALDPLWTAEAELPADRVFPSRIRAEWRRVRRVRRETADPHELRKAAKRLRHALEVLEPVWADRAVAPRKAAQRLTEILGERQDTVAARAALLVLSRTASAAGEDTFTYGRLHAEEERHESTLLSESRGAWRDLESAMSVADW
jgi:CHAD domain-containing protein